MAPKSKSNSTRSLWVSQFFAGRPWCLEVHEFGTRVCQNRIHDLYLQRCQIYLSTTLPVSLTCISLIGPMRWKDDLPEGRQELWTQPNCRAGEPHGAHSRQLISLTRNGKHKLIILQWVDRGGVCWVLVCVCQWQVERQNLFPKVQCILSIFP